MLPVNSQKFATLFLMENRIFWVGLRVFGGHSFTHTFVATILGAFNGPSPCKRSIWEYL